MSSCTLGSSAPRLVANQTITKLSPDNFVCWCSSWIFVSAHLFAYRLCQGTQFLPPSSRGLQQWRLQFPGDRVMEITGQAPPNALMYHLWPYGWNRDWKTSKCHGPSTSEAKQQEEFHSGDVGVTEGATSTRKKLVWRSIHRFNGKTMCCISIYLCAQVSVLFRCTLIYVWDVYDNPAFQPNSSKGSRVPGFHACFEKFASVMHQSQKQRLKTNIKASTDSLMFGICKDRLGWVYSDKHHTSSVLREKGKHVGESVNEWVRMRDKEWLVTMTMVMAMAMTMITVITTVDTMLTT